MKIALAKELFHAGVLTAALICKKPMSEDWIVVLGNEAKGEILRNDKGLDRVFKTLDAAYKAVREVGFEEATVSG